ncbi:hypothetical protein V1477_000956 [Vespula maculifrons]|uniref:Uncharacterized protein n=2 Tax=Vespula TaxID=7451 RepID=A0A834J9E8_VESVU|nr:hypothetical protein HZH66_012514 [Vespula vulgaris]
MVGGVAGAADGGGGDGGGGQDHEGWSEACNVGRGRGRGGRGRGRRGGGGERRDMVTATDAVGMRVQSAWKL